MSQASQPPILDLKASLKKPIQWAFSAAIATAIISLFMPNYYKSEARLLPVEANAAGGMGGLAAAAAAFGVSVGGTGGSDANFVDILKSRWLREQLLNTEFQFQARSWRFGAERPHQETLSAYLGTDNLDRGLAALNEVISSSKDIKSNVISISVETRSPTLSQQVVRRATELLNEFVVKNSRTRGTEKASFAEARLADARRELDQAENAFRGFLESNRNYQVSSDPSVRLRGSRLEAELNLRRQLVSTLALNREQSLLDAKNDIPILNILDAGSLPIEKSRPRRSVLVVGLTILSGALVWGWQERRWIQARLFTEE